MRFGDLPKDSWIEVRQTSEVPSRRWSAQLFPLRRFDRLGIGRSPVAALEDLRRVLNEFGDGAA